MKTKKEHKDVFFKLKPEIAERFLAASKEIRASELKLDKHQQPYVFIKQGFLQEALELNAILWERLCDEINEMLRNREANR